MTGMMQSNEGITDRIEACNWGGITKTLHLCDFWGLLYEPRLCNDTARYLSLPFPIHLQPLTHLTTRSRPNTAFQSLPPGLNEQPTPNSTSHHLCPPNQTVLLEDVLRKSWEFYTQGQRLWSESSTFHRHLTCIQCMAAQPEMWEHGHWWAFIQGWPFDLRRRFPVIHYDRVS